MHRLIEYVSGRLRGALAGGVGEERIPASYLSIDDVSCDQDLVHDTVIIRIELISEPRTARRPVYSIAIDSRTFHHLLHDPAVRPSTHHEITRYLWQAAEDGLFEAQVDHALRDLRQQLQQALSQDVDGAMIRYLRQRIEETQSSMRDHRRHPRSRAGNANNGGGGGGNPYGYSGARYSGAGGGGGGSYSAAEQYYRYQPLRMLNNWHIGETSAEQIQKDREAEARGMALLMSNLTPTQADTYRQKRWFEVVGGTTKTVYRIHHGRQQNVKVMSKHGAAIRGICFLTTGGVCAGDTMLAQKLALECNEEEALKVAIPFAV